jgi:hypothetical protein
MVWKVRGVCCGLGLASVAFASSSWAQEGEPPNQEGGGHEAVVLSLNGSLVDYQKQTLKEDKSPTSSADPPEVKTSQTGYGPLGAGLGFGIGYAWDQVLLGARAELTHVDLSPPNGNDGSLTQVSLLPRIEYMFNRDTARPFIAGILGIQYTGTSQTLSTVDLRGNPSSTKLEDSSTRLAVGAAFGLHGFLKRSVSLDPELTVLYSTGSGTVKDASDNASDAQSQGYSINIVRVLFSVGLSGWLDTGGPLPPPPPRSEVTEAPVAGPAPHASEEPESKPVSAEIRLPEHRRIYLQVPKDAARPSVLVRLTDGGGDTAISQCDDVTLTSDSGPIKLPVRSRGENYLTTRLPIAGLNALANSPNSLISVCGDEWQLTPKARQGIQEFVKARSDLLEELGETEAPTPAPEAPVAAPPADPSVPTLPAPVPAPGSAPTPAPASGAPRGAGVSPTPIPAHAAAPGATGAFPSAPAGAAAASDKSSPAPQKAAKRKP